jgi:hypothetical protein
MGYHGKTWVVKGKGKEKRGVSVRATYRLRFSFGWRSSQYLDGLPPVFLFRSVVSAY